MALTPRHGAYRVIPKRSTAWCVSAIEVRRRGERKPLDDQHASHGCPLRVSAAVDGPWSFCTVFATSWQRTPERVQFATNRFNAYALQRVTAAGLFDLSSLTSFFKCVPHASVATSSITSIRTCRSSCVYRLRTDVTMLMTARSTVGYRTSNATKSV